MEALLEDLRVVTLLNTCRDVLYHVGELVLEGQIHGLLSIATSTVKLDGLVMLAFYLKVLSGLNHVLLTSLQAQCHDLLVKCILLGKSYSVMEPLGLRVVHNGLADVLALLIVPG